MASVMKEIVLAINAPDETRRKLREQIETTLAAAGRRQKAQGMRKSSSSKCKDTH